MAMTKLEYYAKQEIIDILNKQGYPTYAKIFDKFDLNLTSDPNVIGYMLVNKAKIVLNKNLSIDQVSTIVRHEILHNYLQHGAREVDFRSKKNNNVSHELANVAADYEISNRGYTDEDKNISRNIILNDKVLKGLVTEDSHIDWVDKTFEEMLDLLDKDKSSFIDDLLKNIKIGDLGDQNIQDAEESQRQAEAISNDAGEMIDKNNQNSTQPNKKDNNKNSENDDSELNKSTDIKDKADKLGKEAKDLKDRSNEIDQENNSSIFKDNNQKEQEEKIANRISQIKRILNDLRAKEVILGETDIAINKGKVVKKAKDFDKYNKNPLIQFRLSLNDFIKNQISVGRGASWNRLNKKYDSSGIIRPGSSRLSQNKVPLINVYFDRSGSWDANKTESGKQTLSTLNQYVRNGKLKIDLYYFSNNVHSIEQEAIREGGTNGQPILDHIQQTKPDNVIILTDSDIGDCTSDIVVPGAVWMLFYGGRSQNLIDHLKGKKMTKYFDIINN